MGDVFTPSYCMKRINTYLCIAKPQYKDDSVAQPVEHNTFNVGVLGSSPSGITKATNPRFVAFSFVVGLLAQLVEHVTLNDGVQGSSP